MTRLTIQWLLPLLMGSVFFVACSSGPDADVADIQLDLPVVRMDSLMLEAAKSLQADPPMDAFEAYQTHLQGEQAYWFEFMGLAQLPGAANLSGPELDSLLTQELTRSLKEPAMLQLLDTIRQVFPYGYDFSQAIEPPMKRMLLTFGELELPEFRTHVSGYVPGGDLRSADNVVPTPNYFSFGLHYFLGPDYRFYPANISVYQRKRFVPEYLPALMMHEIAEGMVARPPRDKQPLFLDGIVRAGIKQYFVQEMLPSTPDSLLLMYSGAQTEWAAFYEARIYKELIPHLFEGDFQLNREYLSDKPYTTTLSTESAPRIGEYLGWKIVETYMDRHDEVSLAELVERTDYELIFREAKYKP
ncbi:MAG: hypothetical protein AAF399_22440 [Bacteroidota bacterium]